MEKQTILVTGGAGYIGSWVVKELLEKGHDLRVSVRDKSKTEKYNHILELQKDNPGTVELWEANLTTENGFDEAAQGCDSIIHLASPFILDHKDPQKNLIDPALKGTKNVLNAATKSGTVKKIILTSSVAAIHGDNADMTEQNLTEFTEAHFNTSSSIDHQPYSYSKVLAEKEAWKIAKSQNNWDLVVINPSFVLGPSLAKLTNSGSLSFMNDILSGKFKTGAPKLQFGYADVREVAHAHVLALENEKAEGRHIIAVKCGDVMELTQIIGEAFPGKYKLPKSHAPKWLMTLMGPLFGVTRKFVRQNVGHPLKLNNSKSVKQLGLKYRPLKETVIEMVDQMEKMKAS
jgi:nucleoside-diphosphate-sugar epimerase